MTLSLKRTGTREFAGTNQRGAEISVGKGDGQWSPGELLQIALLGCNAMSADHRLASAWGEDFELDAEIEAEYSEAENRYTGFSVRLVPSGADVDPELAQKTVERALGAIARQCTIGRTIDYPVPHSSTIEAV